MLCVPSLGSESSVLESCSRFYTGHDVTTFISPPTYRFTSKKQCSHIPSYLSCQQESTGSPSSVASVWHCGSNGLPWCRNPSFASVNGSYEQDFDATKPSMKSTDAVKQAEKVLKVHFFSGGKPSQQNCSRVKPSNQYFEKQLDEFERVQYSYLCEGAKDIPSDNNLAPRSESPNHAMRSPSLPKSLEQQFSGVDTPFLRLDDGCVGSMHSKQIIGADFTGNEPVWNGSFPRSQWAHPSFENALNLHASEEVLCQQQGAGINGSPHVNGINGSTHGNGMYDFKGIKMEDGIGGDTHNLDVCQPRRQLPNGIQHGKKEQCTGNMHVVNGQVYPDTPYSGSLNGSSVNGFHVEEGYGAEYQSGGDQVLKPTKEEGIQAKEFTSSASSAACKVAAIRMPIYRTSMHLQCSSHLQRSTRLQRARSDLIFYLESLGADSSRIFKDDPMAMTCTVKQLRVLVCVLERYGLKWSDLGRVFNLCPKILHLKPETDLKIVTSFLFDEVGLPPKDLAKVIKRCPRLLVIDVNGQLRPTLSFLRSLGYLRMGHVVSNNPTLLSFSVERKLIPKLRFLESLGFTYREAASMVVRFPAIFNYSVSENLEPKYKYLVQEMGGRNKDLLAFPQYFGYSLETRIRPRHQCVSKHNVSLSIQAILKLSDAEFNVKFLCDKGHGDLSKEVPVSSLETNDVKLHDCCLESSKYVSFEHPETRVLVSV